MFSLTKPKNKLIFVKRSKNMYNVFVYGSLKKNFHNNDLIINNPNNKFLGNARTEFNFDLINLGSFPGMIKGNNSVEGEIYQVDILTLEDLDYLESNGKFYQREEINILDNKHANKAWCYILIDSGEDYERFKNLDASNANRRITWSQDKTINFR
jgi:gamma-glutamylcyclotransferase (GGCT)/AIG2-like uncharacterized protein YtfP